MPYPEYRSWELYYLLEPWGWQNDEYHSAVNSAMLYNINRGKNKAKSADDFMRDLPADFMRELDKPQVEEMTREEIVKQIKKDFGIK